MGSQRLRRFANDCRDLSYYIRAAHRSSRTPVLFPLPSFEGRMTTSTRLDETERMIDPPTFPLRVVDGLTLPPEYRKALRPGEDWKDSNAFPRQLPRYFYEIPSWDSAMKVELATHFLLWEFIQVDVREAPALRTFPRYVPCAITLLAVCLERFREA